MRLDHFIRALCLPQAGSQHLLHFDCHCTIPVRSLINIVPLVFPPASLSVFSLSSHPTPTFQPLFQSHLQNYHPSPVKSCTSLPEAHNEGCTESEGRNQTIHKDFEAFFGIRNKVKIANLFDATVPEALPMLMGDPKTRGKYLYFIDYKTPGLLLIVMLRKTTLLTVL